MHNAAFWLVNRRLSSFRKTNKQTLSQLVCVWNSLWISDKKSKNFVKMEELSPVRIIIWSNLFLPYHHVNLTFNMTRFEAPSSPRCDVILRIVLSKPIIRLQLFHGKKGWIARNSNWNLFWQHLETRWRLVCYANNLKKRCLVLNLCWQIGNSRTDFECESNRQRVVLVGTVSCKFGHVLGAAMSTQELWLWPLLILRSNFDLEEVQSF